MQVSKNRRSTFKARFIHADQACRRLTLCDREPESSHRYFVIDRLEGSPETAVPAMQNVYIELDDQGMGGFGGIERVILQRDSLALELDNPMARKMCEGSTLCFNLKLDEREFEEVKTVLQLILRGYESQLEIRNQSDAL